MCLDIADLIQSNNCDPNAIGLVKYVDYIRRSDITSGPAEAASPTLLEENGRLEGAFVLAATKFWKRIQCTVESSNFTTNAKGRKGGNWDMMANLDIPFSTEQAIGLMNQLKFDDVVYVITTQAGRRFILGWDKQGTVIATPNYDSQNTESSEDAGFNLELKSSSPKQYFLKDDVVIAYA